MGRRRGDGIFGPYPHRNRHRVELRSGAGKTRRESFATREAALKYIRDLRAELASGQRTIRVATEEYRAHLKAKGNKDGSINLTLYRLGVFFEQDLDGALADFTPSAGRAAYKALQARPAMLRRGGKTVATERKVSVDTHRNTLAEARAFLEWCRGEGWVRGNALAEVKGIGRRNHGKEQLRVDEARAWLEHTIAKCEAGEAGPIAALTTILMGMRASEVTTRVVRDLDDKGRLLWIPDAKTPKGKRTLEVPEETERELEGQAIVEGYPLRRYLLGLAEGKQASGMLFGKHTRDWPCRWVQRLCREAKVPEVTAQGMRGLRSTLGILGGLGARLKQTADQLGHERDTTTQQSYIAPGTVDTVRGRTALAVLQGGKR